MKKKNKKQPSFLKKIFKSRWFVFGAFGFFVGLCFVLLFGFYYQDKIYPRIKISGVAVGGKTVREAALDLERAGQHLAREGVFFKYKDKEVVVAPIIVSAEDPGLSKEIIFLDWEKSAEQAYKMGRQKNFFFNCKDLLLILLRGREVEVQYKLDTKELSEILKDNFSSLENPGQDASVGITVEKGKFKVNVIPERLGKSFDYDLAVNMAKNNLSRLSSSPVKMYMKTDYPVIKKEDVQKKIPEVKEVLAIFPVTFSYECFLEKELADLCPFSEKKEIVSASEFSKWIKLYKNGEKVKVGPNKEAIIGFLNKIKKDIEVKAQDARFKLDKGRVVEFQSSKDGIKINFDKTLKSVENNFFNKLVSEAKIILETEKAENSIGDVNDLGIKELIGTGRSNFSGSPKNRRHNIAVGAKSLNGLLIKPDEEFSLVKALGKIDASSGYLPELVIKGNKTVPEYGGGLCQIATTVFRAALYSGLPITERKPHAYRVSYYEPAGMDATIYIPKPDLKFLNDTGHYILIQAQIEGDDLIFKFWGDSQGRKIEVSSPKIFNIVSPGPTKIIETDDLPPGKKKCTESSHNGADAQFKRKIIFPSGEEKEEVWFSRYRPWRAVCLVGKQPDEKNENIDEESNNNNENQKED